jgi:flagellar hook assembly protein FlgD
MDNGEMASQLAQLAQLEQVEAVNNKFDQVLTLSNRVQAAGLIGKEVAFVPADADEPVWATVSAVQMIDGQPVLRAGGHDISLEGIKLIRNPQEEQ